jgi:anti-sigma28 factor (negative regulator of flagellin synthesis)
MIDGIRQNLTYLDPSSRKGAKTETNDGAKGRPATLSIGPGAELVEISASAERTLSGAPIDKTRVEAIRDAIRRNAYPLDFEKLAERMIETDFGLSPRK